MRVGCHRMPLLVCVLLAATAVAGPATGASVFKCRDADGRVYFSDRKCLAGQSGEAIDLAPMPKISGGNAAARPDPLLQDRARRVDNAIEDRQHKRREKANARAARCDKLRDRLRKLDAENCDAKGTCTIYALVDRDAAGNKIVLPEKAKRAEADRLKSVIAKDCR